MCGCHQCRATTVVCTSTPDLLDLVLGGGSGSRGMVLPALLVPRDSADIGGILVTPGDGCASSPKDCRLCIGDDDEASGVTSADEGKRCKGDIDDASSALASDVGSERTTAAVHSDTATVGATSSSLLSPSLTACHTVCCTVVFTRKTSDSSTSSSPSPMASHKACDMVYDRGCRSAGAS